MTVGIIMGSKSDWPTMKHAAEMLDQFGVAYETKVVSAHRTPHLLADYASSAKERGLQVIIAGAGGAAHLPGMTAAFTSLPVLGVPFNLALCLGSTRYTPLCRCQKALRWVRSPLVKLVPLMQDYLPHKSSAFITQK